MTNSSGGGLTAADVMQPDFVGVSPDDGLQEAMDLITENHITGLPVLDRKGRCIGIISTTDILNYEQEHAEFTQEANSDLARHFDAEKQRWESVRLTSFALEEFAEVPVKEVMTRELISVPPEASIDEVARKMLDAQIHRVLVLDEQQYLHGIISSTDFVRLFAEGEASG